MEQLIIKNFNSTKDKNKFVVELVTDLAVEQNVKVSILNSKVSIKDMTKALIQRQAKFNIDKNISNENWKELEPKLINLANSNLYISYTSGISLNELLEKINFVKQEKDIDIIIVDDIYSLTDYEEEKGNIFKELEKISVELHISILAIVQDRICPKCNDYIVGYPALSREDNKTEICSKCGNIEALEIFFKYKENV